MSRHAPAAMRTRHHARGLSLIELMVALGISAILVLGLVQVFSASKMTFGANEALARSQENSRFAMDFLKYDMRMGSHMGCLSDLGYEGNFFNHLSSARPKVAPYSYRFDVPVQVYEAVGTAPGEIYDILENPEVGDAADWDPPLPAELAIGTTALAGSDVVVIRYLSAETVSLTGFGILADAAGTMTVAAADASFLQSGGVYAVTNCGLLSMFQVVSGGASATTVGGDNLRGWRVAEGLALNSRGQNSVQAGNGSEADYGPAMLLRYHFAAYYVAVGGDGRPALFRKELDTAATDNIGAAQEVVPGVESLQIMLGVVDTAVRTGDLPTVYLTAPQVEEGTWRGAADEPELRWRDVVSLRMGMVMVSPNSTGIPGTADKLVADTVMRTPADGRMRQVYETHINVRNRSRG